MISTKNLIRQNKRYAKLRWGKLLGRIALIALANLTEQFHFSVADGDVLFLDSGWYVTHAGLIRLARRNRCAGINVQPVQPFHVPGLVLRVVGPEIQAEHQLVPVDPAEAQILLASASFSTFQIKK